MAVDCCNGAASIATPAFLAELGCEVIALNTAGGEPFPHDPEPLPEGHWMYAHPKVFLTPHSSWASRALLEAPVGIFCENLARFLAGEPLEHVVDVAEGY